MKKYGNIWVWTTKDSILDLRDLIYMNRRWRNTTQSFEGRKLDEDCKREVLSRLDHSDEIGIEGRVQWICDEADYAVFSSGIPILWHSTTTARHGKWVAPLNGSKIKYRSGLRTAVDHVSVILPWLNENGD